MDPVTSPLIHKDSGRRARVDPGEPNPSRNIFRFNWRNPACPDRSGEAMDPVTSPLIQGFKASGPCRFGRAEFLQQTLFRSPAGILLSRIDRSETMDPVTSPLIHKDSGRRATSIRASRI